MNTTQLCAFESFRPEKMMFSKPESGSISGSIPKIQFKRVRINIRNPDNTVGDFILSTPPNLLCYGLQENIDMATGSVSGYVFPICLWGRQGPTPEESLFVDQFNAMVEMCKKHLVENRDSIEKYDLEMNDLKKLNPLYWKMDKGKVVEGRGPMLYAKVLMNKKEDKIGTIFIDDQTNVMINGLDLLNKRCTVTCALKIESIFIGNKISLQIKLFESVVNVVDTSLKTFLRPISTLRLEDDGSVYGDGPAVSSLGGAAGSLDPATIAPGAGSTLNPPPPSSIQGDEEEEEMLEEEEEYGQEGGTGKENDIYTTEETRFEGVEEGLFAKDVPQVPVSSFPEVAVATTTPKDVFTAPSLSTVLSGQEGTSGTRKPRTKKANGVSGSR